MKKRIWAALLTVVMIVGLLPVGVLAADDDVEVYSITANTDMANVFNAAITMATKAQDSKAVVINFAADVDMANINWPSLTKYGGKAMTINGNGHKISNLNNMLFAKYGNSNLTVNDLTMENTVFNSLDYEQAGTFIGDADCSQTVTFNNCHVVGSDIYVADGYTAGFVGYITGYTVVNDGPVFAEYLFQNCSVKNSKFSTHEGAAGGIVGHAAGNENVHLVINDCVVAGNTMTAAEDRNDCKVGAICGTIGNAGSAPVEFEGETRDTGVFVNAYVSDNTAKQGTTSVINVTTVFGRQGSPKGAITITGGTYDSFPIKAVEQYPTEGFAKFAGDATVYILEDGSCVVDPMTAPEHAIITIPGDKADEVAFADDGNIKLPAGSWVTQGNRIYEIQDGTVTVDPKNGKIVSKNENTTMVEVAVITTAKDLWYKDFQTGIMMLFSRQFTLTATAGEGGTISNPGATKVFYDRMQKYVITPADGYEIDTVTVNDRDMGAISEYAFTSVKKDQTIHVTFKPIVTTEEAAEATTDAAAATDVVEEAASTFSLASMAR